MHRLAGSCHHQVDQRRNTHAGRCCQYGQTPLGSIGQLTVKYLALDLQPDDEEENRHQRVVDPQVQRVELGHRRPRKFAMEQLVVLVRPADVDNDHRQRRNNYEQNAGRSFAAH